MFTLYVFTLAPTISWGDSADLPLRVIGSSDTFATATAREYVLYRQLGRFFVRLPFGDIGYRINLMSATFSVLGVVAAYLIVLVRTGRIAAAVAAALALGWSHTWWWMSVVAEVYTFSGCVLLVALLLWLQWTRRGGWRWLAAAGAASGLAASAHAAGTLVLVPVAWLLSRQRGRIHASGFAVVSAAIAAGAAYLIVLVLEILWQHGLTGLVQGLTPTNPHVHTSIWHWLRNASVLLLYQWPVLGTVLAGIGALQLWRSHDTWDRFLLGTCVTLFVWALFDRILDISNSFVFSYAVLAPVVGIGCDRVLKWLDDRGRLSAATATVLVAAVVLLPAVVYTATPAILDRLAIDGTGARRCPERHNNWYFLFPPKRGDYGPLRFARAALEVPPPGAVLLADYALSRPLSFVQQVERRRPDVMLRIVDPLVTSRVLTEFIARTLPHRSVFLAAIDPPDYYDLHEVERSFTIRADGPLYQVVPKSSTTAK